MTDNTETNTGYGLVVPFVDGSESFTNGFEAGMIWMRMENGVDIDMPIHSKNVEVIKRMAVAKGYDVAFQKTEVDGWDELCGRKRRPSPKGGNPAGLRIV